MSMTPRAAGCRRTTTTTCFGGWSLLLALEGEDAQPRPALGLQLLRSVLPRRGEAHDERVLGQLVDALELLQLGLCVLRTLVVGGSGQTERQGHHCQEPCHVFLPWARDWAPRVYPV